jgi:7-carboxy-7-deazaguanine synthase
LLRLNEHYASIQGEGPRTGIPTQFVRFSMCNMRCPLWPCDTQYAIRPSLWKDDPKVEPDDLFTRIVQMAGDTGANNICLTGGEPFMQKTEDLERLIKTILTETEYSVECFSNGSFEYPIWARHAIDIVMDWKLGGSGEAETKRDVRIKNLYALPETSSLKFTICDQADYEEAVDLTHEFMTNGLKMDIWAGVVWGKEMDNATLIKNILDNRLPWKFTLQVHNHVWDRTQRAI